MKKPISLQAEFDWRPWAAAGVAMGAVAACAMALLWPWEAPAVASVDVAALKGAAATAPQRAATAAARSNASHDDEQVGAAMASPFAESVAAPLAGALARPAAPATTMETGESATPIDCGANCAMPAVPASTSTSAVPAASAWLPMALIVSAAPADLDAWALDPQPYAVPAVARADARPLFNTPVIPDDADPTPGEETSEEPATAPAEASTE